MILHLYDKIFRELVELTANHYGYELSRVEKEYWICKILKELALSPFSEKTFFKGGTSLSKGYGVIKRFSEDLDLFVYSGNPISSKQSEKTLNRYVSHFIIENNREMYVEKFSKTGGDFRKLAFSYNSHYESSGLKENVEVEVKCCTVEDKSTMFCPTQKRKIQSVITDYLQAMEKEEIIVRFGLVFFEVQTIDPKRTLCDKISRLTKLSLGNDYEMLIAKHIRDVYDIHCILMIPEYRFFIQSDHFRSAMKWVVDEDGLFRSMPLPYSVANVHLFSEPEKTLKLPTIFRAYHSELKQLMFDANALPPLDEVIDSFVLLQKSLHQL